MVEHSCVAAIVMINATLSRLQSFARLSPLHSYDCTTLPRHRRSNSFGLQLNKKLETSEPTRDFANRRGQRRRLKMLEGVGFLLHTEGNAKPNRESLGTRSGVGDHQYIPWFKVGAGGVCSCYFTKI